MSVLIKVVILAVALTCVLGAPQGGNGLPAGCTQEDTFRCPQYSPPKGCIKFTTKIDGCCRQPICTEFEKN